MFVTAIGRNFELYFCQSLLVHNNWLSSDSFAHLSYWNLRWSHIYKFQDHGCRFLNRPCVVGASSSKVLPFQCTHAFNIHIIWAAKESVCVTNACPAQDQNEPGNFQLILCVNDRNCHQKLTYSAAQRVRCPLVFSPQYNWLGVKTNQGPFIQHLHQTKLKLQNNLLQIR